MISFFEGNQTAMKKSKQLTLLEFTEIFKTEDDCKVYLMDLKWGKGFSCIRCGCTETERSKTWYYKRCKKCKYDESVTANTLFHKLKFPLRKAFHIIFRLSTTKKGSSSIQLANDFGINQKSAWLFRQKAQQAMKSNENHPLGGLVHVDEFTVGGPEKMLRGRSHSAKNKAILGVELFSKKQGRKSMGRAYATCIEDYTKSSFESFFGRFICPDARIETDGFRTYGALAVDYNINQYYSDHGLRFPELHILIMNIKSWLRGIHHKCDYVYMQKYLDEFMFRFNRRSSGNSIFSSLLKRFVKHKPWPLKRIHELYG